MCKRNIHYQDEYHAATLQGLRSNPRLYRYSSGGWGGQGGPRSVPHIDQDVDYEGLIYHLVYCWDQLGAKLGRDAQEAVVKFWVTKKSHCIKYPSTIPEIYM
jgi:hypothetical protein